MRMRQNKIFRRIRGANYNDRRRKGRQRKNWIQNLVKLGDKRRKNPLASMERMEMDRKEWKKLCQK